jgi:hypothetical protein
MTEPKNRAEALAAIAAAVRAAAPLPEAHAEISKALTDRVHVAVDGSTTVLDHDGSVMLDAANGYANATADTLMRELARTKPGLFAKAASSPPSSKPSAPVHHVNGTYAPKHVLPVHDDGKPNLTNLMAAAKAGDTAATAKLRNLMSKSR